MSKIETIDALMRSALALFAASGFEGTSLRDVATKAKVPLSTIHIYFGTKADLYAAVYAHALHDVNEERHAGLHRALEAAGEGKVELRDVIRALVAPVVRRARSNDEIARCTARMLGTLSTVPTEVESDVQRAVHWGEWLPQWIDALRAACPSLTRLQAVWGFSFVVGAMYSWHLLDNRYDPLLDHGDLLDADQIIESLIDFSVGGLERLHTPG
jgi:AcrR family transcriptional regulator